MRCIECGKDIPYDGNVCPWCHRDKSSSQRAATIALVGALVSGGAGYFAAHSILFALLGLAVGYVFWGAVARVVMRSR